jgi:opacity protein-like surface antigen
MGMKNRSRAGLVSLFFIAGGVFAGGPEDALAQGSRDFRFGEPRFSLAFNMGYGIPMANSEIYDFVTTDLTLDKNDFQSMVLGGSFGVRLTNRIEASFEVSYGNTNNGSEFREFVDLDDLPIEQRTKLSWTPVTGTVKAFLWDRGRRVSRFAWVPGQWTPFVGAGAGWVYYNFRQTGDFVDFETFEIFYDEFRSSGDAGIFHLLAGAEVSLTPYIYVTGEGRYSWAEADMDRDFVGFDPIDLSGFQGTVGLAVRF